MYGDTTVLEAALTGMAGRNLVHPYSGGRICLARVLRNSLAGTRYAMGYRPWLPNTHRLQASRWAFTVLFISVHPISGHSPPSRAHHIVNCQYICTHLTR